MIESARLRLREAVVDDSLFLLKLMNEPSYIQFIGDRGLRSEVDAANYIRDKFITSYKKNGFGLYIVEDKNTSELIGICGLVKREDLDHPDLGFALSPTFWGKGFAVEACQGVIKWSRISLQLTKLLAITTQTNNASIAVLTKLDMKFEKIYVNASNEKLKLFSLTL